MSANENDKGSLEDGKQEPSQETSITAVSSQKSQIKYSIDYILKKASPDLNKPGSIDSKTREERFSNRCRSSLQESRNHTRDDGYPFNYKKFSTEFSREKDSQDYRISDYNSADTNQSSFSTLEIKFVDQRMNAVRSSFSECSTIQETSEYGSIVELEDWTRNFMKDKLSRNSTISDILLYICADGS